MYKWFRPNPDDATAPKTDPALGEFPDGSAETPPEKAIEGGTEADPVVVSATAPAPTAPAPAAKKSFRERFVAVMTEPIHFGARPAPTPVATPDPREADSIAVPVLPKAATEALDVLAPLVVETAPSIAPEPAHVVEAQVTDAERALSFREKLVSVLTEPITFGAKSAENAAQIDSIAPDSPTTTSANVEIEVERPRSLRERMAASAKSLTSSVGTLFKRNPKLDDALLDELETALIQSDFGVAASTEMVEEMRVRIGRREFADARALLQFMRKQLRQILEPYARPLVLPASGKPFVILTVGVNGAGKTTTIGKMAQHYKLAGKSVVLAAGDTFRAAAVEQLKMWGERNQVPVISQSSGADSASVIFDALQAATARGTDLLIADTAGRLHTQGHLMAELAKVKRVLAKQDPTAPHETLLVIDGGFGQNAITQARQFHQAIGLTGIVVTKLDGTAKGGTLFALCKELKLPVRFIGVGEQREDLREFKAQDFVDALLPDDLIDARV